MNFLYSRFMPHEFEFTTQASSQFSTSNTDNSQFTTDKK